MKKKNRQSINITSFQYMTKKENIYTATIKILNTAMVKKNLPYQRFNILITFEFIDFFFCRIYKNICMQIIYKNYLFLNNTSNI